MKLLSYLFLLILPLMCSKAPSNNEASKEYNMASADVLYAERSPTINGLISSSPQAIKQQIIKESYLHFETQNLDKTYNQIKQFIIQNKGFIQDDQSNKSYSRITRSLTIRIPINNFQKTIDSISNRVEFFDTKRVSSKDVTEEFIDLEARLKAKQTLEKRYLELLSKAKNVKEILEIEKELSKIREEIEAKQGRLKYLTNKVALSTLNIEFYKHTAESRVTISYGTKMWNAIKSGFNGLSMFFIGILHIWPFIIILIILFFLIKKWLKKKK
ncbi:DUF4349 domain-containing protein [Sabulilitoribacter arenilitoris]|uniref:DUF4349 domain-containing protein n=1 Tax=Wocania arenilitoris TaxID=2044858 RepID=A0AAE3ERH1_9FLAO|nr:DUF4349 domain-containing protein [Wocania arenilitoris]MCF7568725.1 DUF4349 domain-containing protein [Wocania arenilitoris]